MSNFNYTFTCEKCGGQFYSKVDPSSWRHHYCNACSGKPYKDYPVDSNIAPAVPTPRAVPTRPVYNNVQAKPIEKPAVFNLEEYISDMLVVYGTLKEMADEAKLTIPTENLCNWTTSIMIQKGKASIT